MKSNTRNSGIAIALAWPETLCKEPGSWYDVVTGWLGINKKNYYRAGHAALVLVDVNESTCQYFDFGRYHSPWRHGRVRSAVTDRDLKMHTRPKISEDGQTLLNYNELLTELQLNPSCHGEGKLHASYGPVNFQAALDKVLMMQSKSPVPYGPFIKGGNNCSRFVNRAILAGRPGWFRRFRLKYCVPLTPTPLSNVNSFKHRVTIPVMRLEAPFKPLRSLTPAEKLSTLPAPERHKDIPEHAQWLSGEGAGSWFVVDREEESLRVKRYGPGGVIECSGRYQGPVNDIFGSGEQFFVDHMSNCRELTLNCNGSTYRFLRTEEKEGSKKSSSGKSTQKAREYIIQSENQGGLLQKP